VDLPRIDEHAIEIDAPRTVAWSAVERSVPALTGGRRGAIGARLLGCQDLVRTATVPISVGATIPGFRVTEVEPGSRLALEGSHRFSRYRLTFHVDELGAERSRVRAETHAAFPGPQGKAYRALVIGTHGHVLGVRRILSAIRRRAEQRHRVTDG
jgi:hypothetical protein